MVMMRASIDHNLAKSGIRVRGICWVEARLRCPETPFAAE